MHLSDTSSIAQHPKKHDQQLNFGKFLTQTQQYQNDKISKNYRFSRRYILEIYNTNLIELILTQMLMYFNVFGY